MGIDDLPFKNDVAALSMSVLTAVLDAWALFLPEVSRESLLSWEAFDTVLEAGESERGGIAFYQTTIG